VCTARRIPTNTPLQALVTLNDPAFLEMAQAFARSMEDGGGTAAEKIARGYRLLLLTDPPAEKQRVLEQLYDESLAEYRQLPEESAKLAETPESAALVLVAQTLLNLDAALVR
jgi:hypothetical protein